MKNTCRKKEEWIYKQSNIYYVYVANVGLVLNNKYIRVSV